MWCWPLPWRFILGRSFGSAAGFRPSLASYTLRNLRNAEAVVDASAEQKLGGGAEAPPQNALAEQFALAKIRGHVELIVKRVSRTGGGHGWFRFWRGDHGFRLCRMRNRCCRTCG